MSVIVPIRDEPANRIDPTVKSALIAGADEVIAIDDGSAQPPTMYPSHSVSLYSQPARGISAALNLGRSKASGEYLCWLSCGDTMYPEKIDRCLEHLEATGKRAVFHDYRWTGDDGERVQVTPANWERRIWTDNQFSSGMALVAASLWDEVGGFDESIRWCMDWDFACKVQAHSGWVYLPEILGSGAEYRDGHTQRAGRDEALRTRRYQDRYKVAMRWRARARPA